MYADIAIGVVVYAIAGLWNSLAALSLAFSLDPFPTISGFFACHGWPRQGHGWTGCGLRARRVLSFRVGRPLLPASAPCADQGLPPRPRVCPCSHARPLGPPPLAHHLTIRACAPHTATTNRATKGGEKGDNAHACPDNQHKKREKKNARHRDHDRGKKKR
ncbi:hypothetical protein TW95_gp1548 [Pandoravirus inopinatum]|uniref:Uncharacterized protein n=1 Tax=Pandoravirus inopinatum TaxID=1605721 RepID=A0A0B5JER8_9VIRU|nr:hypothetical protein TW95_gp1548 [Pandoravirus inopinatum]AJF98282.1 hypothetical protein [Pandoravirus inopinatum]